MRECLSLFHRPNQSPAFLATQPVSASLGTRSKVATTPAMQPLLNPLPWCRASQRASFVIRLTLRSAVSACGARVVSMALGHMGGWLHVQCMFGPCAVTAALAAYGALSANGTSVGGIDPTCLSNALNSLAACFPDLQLKTGCCKQACWDALNTPEVSVAGTPTVTIRV